MSTTQAVPPAVIPVDLAGVPPALTARRQWVAWRYEWDQSRDEWTKVPANVHTGQRASTTNADSWATFGDAVAYADAHGLPGVGFVFTPDDPYTGVDLDKCRDPDSGSLEPWAAAIVEDLASYSELSPSQSGVHVIVEAALPVKSGRRNGKLEMYQAARYFTVTGHRLPASPDRIARRQGAIDALYEATFGAEPVETPPSSIGVESGHFSDGDVIRLASEAANGDKFRRLFYDGDTSGYGGDDSDADAALCAIFAFWTGKGAAQIDRLFRRSALLRPKWDERRAQMTYGARTIAYAISQCSETYEPDRGQTLLIGGKKYDRQHTHGTDSQRADSEARNHEQQPWPVLDDAAKYGLAGEIADVIDAHTEASEVATLCTLLVMFGNAVGRTPHLMVGNDRHGVNEYVSFVGDTSKARKGSSRSGPQRLLTYADLLWAAERIQGGLSSGEGLLAAIADPSTRLNKKGEIEIIREGSKDKRLTCIEEELSQLLKVAGREGNIVSEIVRRGWDSPERLQTMTKADPLTVTGPHISIIGHITADELRRELDDTARANGFGNRFLWLCVKRSKAEPFLEPIPDSSVADFGRRLQRAIDHARKTTRVQFSDSARAAWREIYTDLSEGKPGLVGAMTARAEAHALRLALIYALLDSASEIAIEHLLAAVALIDYAEASVRYIFGDRTGDPIADRVLAALRASGQMTQNDIYEFFGRHVSSPRIGMALEILVRARLIHSAQEQTGGRPRTVWMAT